MREWYRITAKADETVAELSIFDEIGPSFFNDDAVTAKQFIADVRGLPDAVKTIRVHVNSPGGSVFEAVAIANALRSESRERGRTIEMRIEGLAASAATIVTSAGDSIAIADNALMMIHNPLAIVLGPAKDMREMADLLDKVRDSIVATYRWVSQLSVEAISELMDATTWMNAEEAVKNGFATEVVPGVAVTARWRIEALDQLKPVPEGLKADMRKWEITLTHGSRVKRGGAAWDDPLATKVEEFIAAAVKDGVHSGEFDALLAKHFGPKEQVDAKYVLTACEGLSPKLATQLLDLPKGDVDARVAHAKEVGVLCATAKMPELAEGYILAHTPVATVKDHLTTITAKVDKVEIDSRLVPDAGKQPIKISSAEIYARRRMTPQLGAGRN
jgi:ATP-dependent Clp protease protease subunit